MSSKGVPVVIKFPSADGDAANPAHKRVYVSVNAIAFIFNQIDRRFEKLESMLLEYDQFDGRVNGKLKDRETRVDIGYPKRNDVVAAAWDLIDWVDRLRKVLGAVAGMKKGTEWYKEIMLALASAKGVRNFLQHYDRELQTFVAGYYPLMGGIIASYPITSGGRYARILMSTPVRYIKDSELHVNGFELADEVDGSVGCIILTIADQSINLSDLVAQLRTARNHFADYLDRSYKFPWPDGSLSEA